MPFAAGQGLGQQAPASPFFGYMGLSTVAVPGMAQRRPHERLSLRCRRSPACLCLGCCLCNGDNGTSHGRCGNAAVGTREAGDYAVLALSVRPFSMTARLIDSSNAGFRVLSFHRLAKKKAILPRSNSQISVAKWPGASSLAARPGVGTGAAASFPPGSTQVPALRSAGASRPSRLQLIFR